MARQPAAAAAGVRRDSPEQTKERHLKHQDDVQRIVANIKARESEAAFQRRVRKALSALGYVVWVFPIMKRTIAGVPDLTFWHPNKPGRLHFWELKTQKGRIRPEQVVAIAHLSTVPGVDARIVRPSDWDELKTGLAS